jgi:hypothetical protein
MLVNDGSRQSEVTAFDIDSGWNLVVGGTFNNTGSTDTPFVAFYSYKLTTYWLQEITGLNTVYNVATVKFQKSTSTPASYILAILDRNHMNEDSN